MTDTHISVKCNKCHRTYDSLRDYFDTDGCDGGFTSVGLS